ncbi:hypothetical protein NBO_72g0014 [Nosema bombycis CQ1]|uniref:Uncharacterized protein n=1 Tax=Nosema bombycis (strain CQ1 / CVCC 102059) TaxID=578461 RepID=R0M670_NOSB1|nr:hypothetical protein NBO_72g0014 [Nosema bombycis CQ1]|eukprot:EOB13479.1 hypothetical protein NBO_72g0014 [Nosema bombycis CQ1]
MEPKFIAIAVVGIVLLGVLAYFLYNMFMKKDKKPESGSTPPAPTSSESSSATKPAASSGGATGTPAT